jgi:hypothetical protein
MASPAVIPSGGSNGVLFDLKLAFERRFASMASRPDYLSFMRCARKDDSAGDLCRVFYSNPLPAMPQFNGTRNRVEVTFDYFDQNVRTFASGMAVNVFDILPDAGTPAKVWAYGEAAERLGESAALLWPGLFVQAISTGLTKIWQPDGQPFWGVHYFDYRTPSLGSYRNYFSSTVDGGSAAYPITYANVLAILKHARGFKAPNGLQKAIIINKFATNPVNAPLLRRLLTAERIPSWEATGQTAGTTGQGGDVINEIRAYYGGAAIEVEEIANMPSQYWLALDTSSETDMMFAWKERLPVTWQTIGPGFAAYPFPTGGFDGMVSEMVYRTMETEYGPIARGESYMRNWWGGILCDTTP